MKPGKLASRISYRLSLGFEDLIVLSVILTVDTLGILASFLIGVLLGVLFSQPSVNTYDLIWLKIHCNPYR